MKISKYISIQQLRVANGCLAEGSKLDRGFIKAAVDRSWKKVMSVRYMHPPLLLTENMHKAKKGTLKNSHLVLVGKVENGFRHAHTMTRNAIESIMEL